MTVVRIVREGEEKEVGRLARSSERRSPPSLTTPPTTLQVRGATAV
jgi:hypothetical protein